MRNLIFSFFALLALSACALQGGSGGNPLTQLVTGTQKVQSQVQSQIVAPVATLTANDALSAAAMANSDAINPANGKTRAPCYSAVGNMANTLAGQKGAGIMTGIEASLEGQEITQYAPCQAVAGQVMLNLLQQVQGAQGAAGAAIGGAALLGAPAGL